MDNEEWWQQFGFMNDTECKPWNIGLNKIMHTIKTQAAPGQLPFFFLSVNFDKGANLQTLQKSSQFYIYSDLYNIDCLAS